MGTLFIVATPIGNLQDITARAIETLKSVDLIISEDTRKTGILLKALEDRFNLKFEKTRFLSYFEQNEEKRIPDIVKYLREGLNIALVSDAGTPTISDPGFKLVRECIKQKINVQSIPGPSSLISALVSSGFPTDKFSFLGFLPKKGSHRRGIIEKIKESNKIIKSTFIFFVPPHDLQENLLLIKDVLGDIDLVVARELTKTFEEIKRDKISKLLKHYEEKGIKGEIVVLLNLN